MYSQQFQTNFTSGEISPFVYARTDLKQYDNSARTIQNFIVRPQGGIMKRSGTIFVAEVKDSTQNTRIIPFEYSNTQTYIIEAGNGYFRFFKDGGEILSTAAFVNGTFATDISSWTTSNTGTGTAVWSPSNGGSLVVSGGTSGVGAAYQSVPYVGTNTYHLSFRNYTNTVTYKIGTTVGGSDIATGTSVLGANNIAFTPTTDGTVYFQLSTTANVNAYVGAVSLDTPIYQIASPFSAADVDLIQYAESFDVLFMVHPNFPPKQMTRFNHAQWTLTNITFTDGPYFDKTDKTYGGIGTTFTMSTSATTGTGVTMTCSSSVFVASDVGRFIRYRSTATAKWGYAVITGYTSGTAVTVTVKSDFDSTGASKEWRLGSWSTSTGYPTVIGFHEQRMIFAATAKQQQTVWFSEAGSLYNFQPDNVSLMDAVDDSTAMTYAIADNEANVIYWVASGKILFMGTSSGVWSASASTLGLAITPTNISIKVAVKEPSANKQGFTIKNCAVYVQQYKRKLLEVSYVFYQDIYNTDDLAKLAEHRTKGNIKWTAQQQTPNYLTWCCMEDGSLSAITYLKEEGINAWHSHILGGTNSAVQSIATISGATEDEVWMVVKRTINGVTKQYVEYFAPSFLDQDLSEANFLDCSAPYSGSSATIISGLNFLEGQTVQAFSNGYQVTVLGPVTGGSITLASPITSGIIGLPYVSALTTNQFNAPVQGGTSQGRVVQISQVDLRFYNSYGGSIGTSSSADNVLPSFSDSTIMGSPVILFNGDKTVEIQSQGTLTPLVYFEHALPLPCHLLGIVYKASVSAK